MIWDEANTPRYHPYYTAQKGNVSLRPVTGPAVSAFHAAAPRWLVSVLWESLQPKAFLSKGKTGNGKIAKTGEKGGFPKTRTALESLEKEIQAFEENLRFAQDGLDSSPFVLLY